MERQIVIQYSNGNTLLKVKKIAACLGEIVDADDTIICNICLNSKDLDITSRIETLKQLNLIDMVEITPLKGQEQNRTCNLMIHLCNIEHFLMIVEEYEFNALIMAAGVKLFINDNDGDFIIIDSKHKKFHKVKSFLMAYK